MKIADKNRAPAEVGRQWMVGLCDAIRAQTGKDAKAEFEESNRAAAMNGDSRLIFQSRFGAAEDTLVWVVAPNDTGTTIGDAILRLAKTEDRNDELRKKTWHELVDRAAESVAAAQDLDGTIGSIDLSDSATFLPDQTAHVYSVNLSLEGENFPALFIGIPDSLGALARMARGGSSASAVGNAARSAIPPTLDMLLDLELRVSVSFGRTYLPVRDVLRLSTGSIIELNCPVNELVEVIVNNRTIARGEVVVVEGNYGVRIHEIISRHERMFLQYIKD